jgi:hypothetical protein
MVHECFSDNQINKPNFADGIAIDPGKTLDVLREASPDSNRNPTATVDITDLVCARIPVTVLLPPVFFLCHH